MNNIHIINDINESYKYINQSTMSWTFVQHKRVYETTESYQS